MEITGHLKLDNLLSEFTYLEEEFRFNAQEYEIETTDGEYLFADIKVDVTASHNYEDNSIVIEHKDVQVVLHEDYFGMDKDGGELELYMNENQRIEIEEEIKKKIEFKVS